MVITRVLGDALEGAGRRAAGVMSVPWRATKMFSPVHSDT